MEGQWIKFPDGTVAHICYAKRPRAMCEFCSAPGSYLCDYPVKTYKNLAGETVVVKTCDAKICARHAKQVGEDRDFCPRHS